MRAYKSICERWAAIIATFTQSVDFIKKSIQ